MGRVSAKAVGLVTALVLSALLGTPHAHAAGPTKPVAPAPPVPALSDSPPTLYQALRQQAESLSSRGRHAEALRAFQRARRAAVTVEDEARIWFRIAGEYSRLGALAAALDAYARQQALVPVDPVALGNAAELLMALGQLEESVKTYREALAIEERARDRRRHISALALGYLGLGVALDRSDRPEAAREAISRGLALDPGLGVLRLVEQATGELSVVPPEDVSYYLALARETQGRRSDAATAFRAYVAAASPRAAKDAVAARYLERARAHLTALAGPPPGEARPAPPPDSRGLRVVRTATLESKGPVVAPLIDAAWRLDPRLLDGCFADVPAAAVNNPLRLDVVLDANGRVTSTAIDGAAALPEGMVPCIAAALESRLRVPRPARKKPTRARIEVVLAPVEPSGV